MKKLLAVLSLPLIMILLFTFIPSEQSDQGIIEAYMSTSSYANTYTDKEIREKIEQLQEQIDTDGRILLHFPLGNIGDRNVYEGDMFDSWGRNEWRREPRLMDDGSTRPAGKHGGNDIAVEGNPRDIDVLAVTDGTIKFAGEMSGAGYTVILIEESVELTFTYMHMQAGSLTVETGDTVTAGQVLGLMGKTGYSTGEHLHIGVTVPGTGHGFETVDVRYVVNGLDFFDPRYFMFKRDTMPENYYKNVDREGELQFD